MRGAHVERGQQSPDRLDRAGELTGREPIGGNFQAHSDRVRRARDGRQPGQATTAPTRRLLVLPRQRTRSPFPGCRRLSSNRVPPRPAPTFRAQSAVISGAQHLSERFRSAGLRACWGSSPIPMTRPSARAARSPSTPSAGADVRVVSFTKGGAGQIRDASVATRATLTGVRAAGARRGGHGARPHRDEMPRLSGWRTRTDRRFELGQAGVGAAQ